MYQYGGAGMAMPAPRGAMMPGVMPTQSGVYGGFPTTPQGYGGMPQYAQGMGATPVAQPRPLAPPGVVPQIQPVQSQPLQQHQGQHSAGHSAHAPPAQPGVRQLGAPQVENGHHAGHHVAHHAGIHHQQAHHSDERDGTDSLALGLKHLHLGVRALEQAALGQRGSVALAELRATVREVEDAINNPTVSSSRGVAGGFKKAQVRALGPRGSTQGFRKLQGGRPVARYTALDQKDPIDIRLEEFYNSTGSAVQFQRINKGFYRFGESLVELDIINHKLMARTEDGWNRGKYAPIEKFIMHYENVEREKMGIPFDD